MTVDEWLPGGRFVGTQNYTTQILCHERVLMYRRSAPDVYSFLCQLSLMLSTQYRVPSVMSRATI